MWDMDNWWFDLVALAVLWVVFGTALGLLIARMLGEGDRERERMDRKAKWAWWDDLFDTEDPHDRS